MSNYIMKSLAHPKCPSGQNETLTTYNDNTPTLDNEAIGNQLKALLTPAIATQQKYYKQLGLRNRS